MGKSYDYGDGFGEDEEREAAQPKAEGPPVRTSFTHKLTEPQQATLTAILRQGNYRPVIMEHTLIAAETASCRIALYKSGKCLAQGKGAQDFVTFVLEPQVLQTVGVGYEEELNPESYSPHMGVDESGKGDFFGPMVIAAAYTDRELAKTLISMGVRDSKTITSDRKARDMARDIQKLLGKRFSLVVIGPAAYNRLYAKMRSVNTLLAWGHARAIENLMAVTPDCPKAISDQFGSKQQVQKALMGRGQKIELVQRHKAESDIAVAAASVLARAGFLQALENMKNDYGMVFPKGASDLVQKAGAELIDKHGVETLLKTAKCHFRTTDAVLEKKALKRSALGPEGAAVSKPFTGFRKGRPSTPPPA